MPGFSTIDVLGGIRIDPTPLNASYSNRPEPLTTRLFICGPLLSLSDPAKYGEVKRPRARTGVGTVKDTHWG